MSTTEPTHEESIPTPIDLSECRDPLQWVEQMSKHAEQFSLFMNQLIAMNIDDLRFDIDKSIAVIKKSPYEKVLLRALNNIYFSDADNKLTDVHRSCVLLGFQSVRNTALIYCLFKELLQFNAENIAIQQEIALSIHSAIIATLMEKARNKTRNNEPSIVALLMPSVAKILLLHFGGDNAVLYSQRAEHRDLDAEDEKTLFGFTFNDLAVCLCKHWNLGDLLEKLLAHESGTHSYHFIFLAHDLAFSLHHGWRSKTALASIESVEKWLNLGVTEMRDFLMRGVEMAFEELDAFDHVELLDHIKLPQSESDDLEDVIEQDGLHAHPDKHLLKNLLTDLHKWPAKHKGRDYNAVLQHVVDSMISALDCDRALVALLTPDHRFLHGRIINEVEVTGYLERFQIDLANPEGWLFQHMLREKRPAWMGNAAEKVLKRYRNAALTSLVGRGQFYLAPIVVNSHSIGCLLLDRAYSRRPLNTVTYEAFIELSAAVNNVLNQLAK